MLELRLGAGTAEAVRHAARPQVSIPLALETPTLNVPVHAAVIECQVMIDAAARRYGAGEERALFELFGAREQWGRSVRSLLWTVQTVMVEGFEERGEATLYLPCDRHAADAAARYLSAVDEGSVPLLILPSGTVFYRGGPRGLLAAPIARSTEARCALPIDVVHEAFQAWHPDREVLAVGRDVARRLERYRIDGGMTSLDEALERLLIAAEEARRSA